MFDFSTIDEVRLGQGSHESPDKGMCFMEMVAWFEGEAHSDKPKCACPVLGAYGIGLNDAMPGTLRDRLLKPLVPMMAGTRSAKDGQARAEFLAMWGVNKILPVVLRENKVEHLAQACEAASDLKAALFATYSVAHVQGFSAAYFAADAAHRADRAMSVSAAYTAALAVHQARFGADIFTLAVEGLRQAILIGRHDGFTEIERIAERRAALRELVAA